MGEFWEKSGKQSRKIKIPKKSQTKGQETNKALQKYFALWFKLHFYFLLNVSMMIVYNILRPL